MTSLVLVIDLEATCCNQGSVQKQEMETIQIGAVIASVSGKVLGEWSSHVWAAAGFKDTLLRWSMKPEVVYGDEKEIQPRVQA